MRTVAVIGAGQMGSGIAQVSAAAGYHVLLSDVDIARAQAGKDGIAKAVHRLVEREKIGVAEAEQLISRIEPVASYEPMASAGLVIEAATEREDIKRKIFEEDALGKSMVFAEDVPGFIVNRILMPMLNEACFSLGEGVASIRDIDMACQIGLNHPMGPLTLADFIGLDTCFEIIKVLHDTTGDSKYRPAPLLVKYVEAGWLGRKTKRGFYDYTGDVPVPTR